MWRKFIRGVNHLAANNGEGRFETFDFLIRHGEVIGCERNQVSELAIGDCSFLPAFARKPTAALCVEP